MDTESRMRLGWAAVVLLFVIAVILIAIDVVRFRSGEGVSYGRAAIGAPAPDAPFATLDGRRLTLRGFTGRPLLVNFFATWCVPCKQELPLIESRYVSLASKGFTVIGVDEQEDAKDVRAFARAHGVTFPVMIDRGDAIATYGGHSIPTSLFIDGSGVLRAVHVGVMDKDMLDGELAKIGL